MTSMHADSKHVSDGPPDIVTFLMTDIENSTQLQEALGDEFPGVIARSRQLIDAAVARYGGMGAPSEGDAFFAVFHDAAGGLRAAVDIQRAFNSETWPLGSPVRVRIGLHTGESRIVGGDYFGPDVHRAARIKAAANGGQVLLSLSTRAQLSEGELHGGVVIRDLGAHRLKDIRSPEVLFDLSIPDLPNVFGSVGPPGSRPNNLPLSPNELVGREQQLHEVRDLLLRPDTRLLTLTGAGGTGKTRLALEVAGNLLESFAHGVFLVQLAPVSDPDLLASTIVQTLEVPEFATKTPLETLKHHLAHREVLLVLDNFEQIVAASEVVLELLRDCERLKVLVTSREGLNVRLERQYAVPPLGLPHDCDPSDIQSVAMIESVRLLIDRVQDHDRAFTLNAENADALCSICARLDGLPLALELAAAQLTLYTPQSLLEDLRNSLDVLADGPRDLARHQRTLNDTIRWSYDLLDEDEQVLFRNLSVFRGGATVDAAVSVGSAGQPRAKVMKTLRSLGNKGLLRQISADGAMRVAMLETIRGFANQRLTETGAQRRVQERHAAHYRALAEELESGLVGRDQRKFVTPLLNEEDNLRAALAWAIEQGDSETTSALLYSLLWMWIPRGQFAEGRAWAGRALDAFGALPPSRELGLIFESAGWLHVLGGDYDERALTYFEHSYDVFHELPDVRDRVRSKITLGVTCLVTGDARGGELTDQAVAICPPLGDQYLLGLARLAEGIKHQLSGNAVAASEAYEAALVAFSECDHVYWRGQLLQNLAQLRLQAGDWRKAGDLAAQALDLGRTYNYPLITNLALAAMGAVGLGKGSAAEAARFFGAVDASLSELGVTFEPPEHAAMQENIGIAQSLLGEEGFAAAFQEGQLWGDNEIDTAVRSLRDDLNV